MDEQTIDNSMSEETASTPSNNEMGRQMELQRAEEQVHNDAVNAENDLILGKYKDYDALEKAHLHQSKFVGQKQSEFVGAPEGDYEYTSPFESIDIDISNGPVRAWVEKAREMNLSPEGFKQITDTFAGIQAEMAAGEMKSSELMQQEQYDRDIATLGGEHAAEQLIEDTLLRIENFATAEDAEKVIQDCTGDSLLVLARMFKQMDYSDIPDDPSLGHRGVTRESILRDKTERNRLVKEGKLAGKALQDVDEEISRKFEVLYPGNFK